MDTLLLPGQNPRAWAETMINLEARKLVNTANTVAAMHLQDGFIRIQFVDEIRAFIMAQFEAARLAKTDDDCMACLRALRAENTSLGFYAGTAEISVTSASAPQPVHPGQ